MDIRGIENSKNYIQRSYSRDQCTVRREMDRTDTAGRNSVVLISADLLATLTVFHCFYAFLEADVDSICDDHLPMSFCSLSSLHLKQRCCILGVAS